MPQKSQNNLVIIGAGIAGLTCAQTLILNSFCGKITILELGNNHLNRYCAIDQGKLCTNCFPCNTISGFGGSVHYGDTIKLSYFPSGNRLQKLIGYEESIKAQKNALNFFSKGNIEYKIPNKDLSLYIKKIYPIGTLNSVEAKKVINTWFNTLSNFKNFEIIYKAKFLNIIKNESGFEVKYKSLEDNTIKSLKCRFFVFATGRAGFKLFNDELIKFGIKINKPNISIGFRFIMPNYILENVDLIHPDFKTTLYKNNFKYKTFCFSAGSLGGRIKHANHGKYTLIDGHSITNEKDYSKFSNFGLLSQIKNEDNEVPSFEWIENNIISKYISLNKKFPGKPVIQSYTDFKHKKISTSSLEHISRFVTKTYDVGDLSSLISKSQHKGFCNVLEELLQEFCRISNINESIENILEKITVLGLELESIWNEIVLTSEMETSINDIYAIGDCTGIAQGILQASVGGVISANSILKKTEKM